VCFGIRVPFGTGEAKLWPHAFVPWPVVLLLHDFWLGGVMVITYPSYGLMGGVVSVPSDNVLIMCLIIWFSHALCLVC
jgi:hypothetical protein